MKKLFSSINVNIIIARANHIIRVAHILMELNNINIVRKRKLLYIRNTLNNQVYR